MPAAITQGLIAALEGALNHYLRLDPAILPRLAELKGKVIAVEFEGLAWRCFLLPGPGGVQVRSEYDVAPDTILRGTPWALLRLGGQSQGGAAATASFFAGAVDISGDVELGQRFKQILDAIDIDWEDLLAKAVGDVLAHQAGNAVRQTRAWGTRTLETLGQNFAEYQQEEIQNLPAASAMNEFLQAVDTLRDDVERTEARVQRLKERLRSSPEGSA